jgi:hypothetical protein
MPESIIHTVENYLQNNNILYFKFESDEYITFGIHTDIENYTLIITFHNNNGIYTIILFDYKNANFEDICDEYKDKVRESLKTNNPYYIYIYSEYAKLYLPISKDNVLIKILAERENKND